MWFTTYNSSAVIFSPVLLRTNCQVFFLQALSVTAEASRLSSFPILMEVSLSVGLLFWVGEHSSVHQKASHSGKLSSTL